MPNKVIKVIVVDDHQVVRRGIMGLLSEAEDVKIVGGAGSGEKAIELVRTLQPDVVLMDLFLPTIDGIETSNRILRIDPEIKILILTSSASEIFSARLLEEGVAGYLTKDCSVDEILQAIRMVYLGRRYVTPVMAQKLALKRYNKDNADSPFEQLSKRELQIAMKVIRGDSARQIAEALSLSPKTISTHRHRLFQKLGVKNDVELTLLAKDHGFLDDEN